MTEENGITKEKAVALAYEKEDIAPKVKASGQGFAARRIIEIAKENNIPIVEDPALIEVLARLDIDTLIPPELYQVVAEILAYVYKIEQSA